MSNPSRKGGSRQRQSAGETQRRSDDSAVTESKSANPQSEAFSTQSGQAQSKAYEKIIARWTIVLGVSTAVLSFAILIGAYFLFETNQTIRKQVAAAQAQLRAYVGFNQILYVPNIRKEPDKPAIFIGGNVAVTWKNFGGTPAREFEYWVSAKWYPNGTEPDFSKPDVPLPGRSIMTLGANNEIPSAAIFIPVNDIQKAASGNGKVFLWGHALYRDLFPDTPARNFHFCLTGDQFPLVENAPASFGIYKPECNYSD
jgi:hypothetical protein